MEIKKRGGVVGDLISGTGGLIITTVVILVIVSTLLGANLLNDTTHTNSTFDENGYINPNETYYQLGVTHNSSRFGFVIIEALNDTDDILITVEDEAHGELGDLITKARHIIEESRYE